MLYFAILKNAFVDDFVHCEIGFCWILVKFWNTIIFCNCQARFVFATKITLLLNLYHYGNNERYFSVIEWLSQEPLYYPSFLTLTHQTGKLNQIFNATVLVVLRRSMLRVCGAHFRVIALGQQPLSKKCRSGGESLATLCPIWSAWDLNLKLPAPETNALPLDQL